MQTNTQTQTQTQMHQHARTQKRVFTYTRIETKENAQTEAHLPHTHAEIHTEK